jgi:phytoene synthase
VGNLSARAVAEKIASRDLNNLYLASLFFKDHKKYQAFCAYYALMRVVDDRIDGLPTRMRLSDQERRLEHEVVSAWKAGVQCCYDGRAVPKQIIQQCRLADAQRLFDSCSASLDVFRPPQVLWASFFRSMHWDLDHERFDSWLQFLSYAEGASVAPTTIYLFLIVSRRRAGSVSLPAGFDVIECGRQLGVFAYLGHILRDVAEDLRRGDNGLIYICGEDMKAFGVTEQLLFRDAERGRSSSATRRLVAELSARARTFLASGRSSLRCLSGQLERDSEFILELILTVYERVLDKIEDCSFDPMGLGHRLTLDEKEQIMKEVADRLNFRPMMRTTIRPSQSALD